MSEPVYQVLVSRILRLYNPRTAIPWEVPGSFRRAVSKADSITKYEDEPFRSDEYHLGRIRFFCDQITAEETIEPVEIDNYFDPMGPSSGIVVIDGHHRLIAADLTKLIKIPVCYAGLVDGIRWLTGRRRTIPEDWQ